MDNLYKSRARLWFSLGNFGFRVHYNKLFKPEYLPARVRYSQFFFYTLAIFATGKYMQNVS